MKNIGEIRNKLIKVVKGEFHISELGAEELICEICYDRSEIKGFDTIKVYNSLADCSKGVAFSLGLATMENEKWFNFDKFQESLEEKGNYMGLSTGEVVYLE